MGIYDYVEFRIEIRRIFRYDDNEKGKEGNFIEAEDMTGIIGEPVLFEAKDVESVSDFVRALNAFVCAYKG